MHPAIEQLVLIAAEAMCDLLTAYPSCNNNKNADRTVGLSNEAYIIIFLEPSNIFIPKKKKNTFRDTSITNLTSWKQQLNQTEIGDSFYKHLLHILNMKPSFIMIFPSFFLAKTLTKSLS